MNSCLAHNIRLDKQGFASFRILSHSISQTSNKHFFHSKVHSKAAKATNIDILDCKVMQEQKWSNLKAEDQYALRKIPSHMDTQKFQSFSHGSKLLAVHSKGWKHSVDLHSTKPSQILLDLFITILQKSNKTSSCTLSSDFNTSF